MTSAESFGKQHEEEIKVKNNPKNVLKTTISKNFLKDFQLADEKTKTKVWFPFVSDDDDFSDGRNRRKVVASWAIKQPHLPESSAYLKVF